MRITYSPFSYNLTRVFLPKTELVEPKQSRLIPQKEEWEWSFREIRIQCILQAYWSKLKEKVVHTKGKADRSHHDIKHNRNQTFCPFNLKEAIPFVKAIDISERYSSNQIEEREEEKKTRDNLSEGV